MKDIWVWHLVWYLTVLKDMIVLINNLITELSINKFAKSFLVKLEKVQEH